MKLSLIVLMALCFGSPSGASENHAETSTNGIDHPVQNQRGTNPVRRACPVDRETFLGTAIRKQDTDDLEIFFKKAIKKFVRNHAPDNRIQNHYHRILVEKMLQARKAAAAVKKARKEAPDDEKQIEFLSRRVLALLAELEAIVEQLLSIEAKASKEPPSIQDGVDYTEGLYLIVADFGLDCGTLQTSAR